MGTLYYWKTVSNIILPVFYFVIEENKVILHILTFFLNPSQSDMLAVLNSLEQADTSKRSSCWIGRTWNPDLVDEMNLMIMKKAHFSVGPFR